MNMNKIKGENYVIDIKWLYLGDVSTKAAVFEDVSGCLSYIYP
jgi:hypothetical protein